MAVEAEREKINEQRAYFIEKLPLIQLEVFGDDY